MASDGGSSRRLDLPQSLQVVFERRMKRPARAHLAGGVLVFKGLIPFQHVDGADPPRRPPR